MSILLSIQCLLSGPWVISMCQWGIVMLNSVALFSFFFTEKDIILHIQSHVFIYLFTCCNHGCFQTSYKCVKARGSIHGEHTTFYFFFFFFLLGFYSTTAPEGIKISRVSDTAEEFLRHICILTLNLVLLKYQTILI